MTVESNLYLIHKSCLRKQGLTLKQADEAVDRFAKKGKLIYYYKCAICCSHHLTRNVPNKKVDHKINYLLELKDI